jgi:thiamine-monophosphate kinase
MGEFDLIATYFKRPARHAVLGVGDDCALWHMSPGTHMAISSDMLVEGRHFFADVDPQRLGHKALAVNLSDLAACGATPRAFTLALALPQIDAAWLAGFSKGLFALADAHACELIGGDTTQGPLNICITVFGEIPHVGGKSLALLRSGAQVGDDIYVSGTLGDARLALDVLRGQQEISPEALELARQRLEKPTPRVALGQALRGIAHAAIDISDGFLGDLQHILQASGVGACIDTHIAINLIATQAINTPARAGFWPKIADFQLLEWILAGGDDYELAFTAPPARARQVEQAAQQSATRVTRVGRIEAAPGVRLLNAQGEQLAGHFPSFDHFKP